jgi:flavin reductase (DIM6/NTAB) family NADH-FMN oxidoreductase RutF
LRIASTTRTGAFARRVVRTVMRMKNAPHVASEPAILYFGTPVVLISTTNEDGTANLAPMSSAFWLGWRCVLGLGASSKTAQNLRRTGECVLNLPSIREVAAVDRLAKLTGASPVPPVKAARGYTHEASKFAIARLTPVPSETVAPPRALECPIHLEAVVAAEHSLMEDTARPGALLVFEVRVQRVHLHPEVLFAGETNRVDPARWRPLIMSFQKFYGLADGEVHPSRLGEIAEALYRSPDVDRARLQRPRTPGAD